MNETIRLILTIIQVLVSISMVIVVLMQSSKQEGLSGVFGGAAESFFGKDGKRSAEAKLEKITAILAGAFIVLTLVLSLF